MEHKGAVQVRKPEKHTSPTHFYVGGGNQTLNPLAHQRIEGFNLFNDITHLDHVGDKNHGILDRFLAPFVGHPELDNTSLLESATDAESHEQEGDTKMVESTIGATQAIVTLDVPIQGIVWGSIITVNMWAKSIGTGVVFLAAFLWFRHNKEDMPNLR